MTGPKIDSLLGGYEIGIDEVSDCYGGIRIDWMDLFTWINPVPVPAVDIPQNARKALPDTRAAMLIYLISRPFSSPHVDLPGPVCKENQAAFSHSSRQGVCLGSTDDQAIDHPNNSVSGHWPTDTAPALGATNNGVENEFYDASQGNVLIQREIHSEASILKCFGELWGRVNLWLGGAISGPNLVANIQDRSGPSQRPRFEAISL